MRGRDVLVAGVVVIVTGDVAAPALLVAACSVTSKE